MKYVKNDLLLDTIQHTIHTHELRSVELDYKPVLYLFFRYNDIFSQTNKR
jgi:hypothetical protein